jgi:hypothetical protein
VTKTETASNVTLWQIARLAGVKVSVHAGDKILTVATTLDT